MAASAVAGLILGGVGIADARDSSRTPDDSPTSSASPIAADTEISQEQAEAIAILTVGGGVVESVELEQEDGGLQWHIDVIKDGAEFDVRIDADTGAVVRFRDDDGDDDRRADDGRADNRNDDGDRDDDGRHGDDHDNSGPGSGDNHDDNSGPGSGDDD